MKTGLVLEGGAMRGMFTAGILDVFMENDINFDGAIGVSAGAVFGCNIKSKQIGRSIRYNKKYCNDKRYASFRSLIRTGDIYNVKFDYEEIPNRLDVFDTDTFSRNPMEFYVVATDVETGGPVYYKCETGDARDITWMRASASMPGVSNIVEVDGYKLLDGGPADSIPLKYFERIGYEKNVVITTRPIEYVKEKNKMLPLLKLRLRKYPNMVRTLAERHFMYNETLEYLKEKEKGDNTLVIRPPMTLPVHQIEHDPEALENVYQIGRKEGEKYLDQVKKFLQE